MPIYDIDGNILTSAYDVDGNILASAYDVDGNDLLSNIVENRLLVWHDEFDGNVVDSQKWENLYGYYTNNRYYMRQNDLLNNAYCQDGILHIVNKRDAAMPLTEWTGAFLWTNGIFEFRYGLVEAKIKFPNNPSYHSTIWAMGSGYKRICYTDRIADSSKGLTWPMCGEIDIAEADSGVVMSNTIWKNSSGGTSYGQSKHVTSDKGSKWHIYGMEWTEDLMKIYCDRKLVWTFNVNDANVGDYNAFRRSHFLILNQLPASSSNFGPNSGKPQFEDMLETQVDWVRVYAPEGVSEVIPDTALALDSASLSMSVSDTHLLTGLFTPSNPTNMTLTWVSSAPSVAMVYGGKVTALASGTATITATTKNGHSATCTVVVN